MTITDPAVERFVNGPAPYSSGNAVPASRPRYKSAEQETADRMAGMYDLLVDGLNQITECTTSEDEQPEARCDHSESLYGRCVSCGMTWQEQEVARRGEG